MDNIELPVNNNVEEEIIVEPALNYDESDVVDSLCQSEDIVGLWNLSLLASIKVNVSIKKLFPFYFVELILSLYRFFCMLLLLLMYKREQDTLESDERPSELSDIAEEPEEYQDCSSDGVSIYLIVD